MGRVRKFAIGSTVTVGLILLLLAGSKKFDIGGQLKNAIGGAGSFIPDALSAFIGSFAEGTSGLGENFVKIAENFQRSISGGLLFSEQEVFGGGGFAGGTVTEQAVTPQGGKLPTFLTNAFQAFQPDLTRNTEQAKPSQVLPIQSVFSFGAQEQRLRNVNENLNNENSARFGDFGSALAQESELQKAVAKARAQFPQFFKLPDTGRITGISSQAQSGQFVQRLDSSGRPIRGF